MENQALLYGATGALDNDPPTGAWIPIKQLGDGGLWTYSNLVGVSAAGDQLQIGIISLNDDDVSTGLPAVITFSPMWALGGGNFDRVRSQGNEADDIATDTQGVVKQASFTYAFDGTTFDRVRSGSNAADAIATGATGNLAALSYSLAFNGTTFDRVRAGSNAADAIATGAVGNLASLAYNLAFNGTAFDRVRNNSAANLTASTQPTALMTAPPGNWSITHTPTTNTQATITRAAGAAGVRHVCTSISCALSAPAAATSGVVQINLRDGATGAGTILWSQTLQVGGATSIAAGVVGIALSGLSIVGSAATAMTLEFSAAGGANTSESVSMTGYDTI